MINVRQVELFDPDAIKALTEPIFGDAARHQYMDALIGAEARARFDALHESLPQPRRIRIGAFDGERLVGCSSGWFESGSFYIGLSAVDPAYRRGGLYTRMLCAVEHAVRELGGLSISSHHVATNNAVLIAKLKLGYAITGTEYDEQMGLLVSLKLHLAPGRRALFAERTGTLVPPAS
ncbi:MAG: GNAT family N-acetyltransferase [Burkholderiales bacterium]